MSLSKYKDHLPEYIQDYIELHSAYNDIIEYGPKAIGALLVSLQIPVQDLASKCTIIYLH